jgi:hypothetical protein
VLDFFEIIDGFEEQGETYKPAGKKDNRKHTNGFAARTPKGVPDHAHRSHSHSREPTSPCNPIKMVNDTPKWKYSHP